MMKRYPNISLGYFAISIFMLCSILSLVTNTFADDTRPATIQKSTISGNTATLTPQNLEQSKLDQAAKLQSDYKSGKLSESQAMIYKKSISKAKSEQKAALDPKRSGSNSLTSSNTSKACKCTAYCQTIIWASNAGSYEWSATGTVSGPSACADAAVATCGGAYATFLTGWTCENIE